MNKPASQQVFRMLKLGLAFPPVNTLSVPASSPALPASHVTLTPRGFGEFPLSKRKNDDSIPYFGTNIGVHTDDFPPGKLKNHLF